MQTLSLFPPWMLTGTRCPHHNCPPPPSSQAALSFSSPVPGWMQHSELEKEHCGLIHKQNLGLLINSSLARAVCQTWVTLHPRGHLPAWLSVNTLTFITDSPGCDSQHPRLPALCPVVWGGVSPLFLFLRTPEYLTLILLVGLRLCISNKLPGNDSAPGLRTKDSKTADQRPQLEPPRRL